ncbi:putative primary-amine oxidase [Rosa chinensis]|uniref:Amine oxidase n=1 Tax=Rosa chinensis TaxID=74649 RepID=A0A2P6QWY8_ROSCH|nr:putative primary-amine oxidase [Rosa chinensis]
MAPSLLLLFSAFIIVFSPSLCLKQHPLDSLTPSEFTQIKTILAKTYPAHNISFQYVGLDEPKKSTVLLWNSKSNTKSLPSRRALVVTRINRQTHKSIVDLSTSSVVTGLPQRLHPAVLARLRNHSPKRDCLHTSWFWSQTERTAVSELPFTYKPFLKSMKNRGLNISQVVCTTFSVGWFGENKSRLSKLNCFYTDGTVNLYVTPVEGITVVVDLEEVFPVFLAGTHIWANWVFHLGFGVRTGVVISLASIYDLDKHKYRRVFQPRTGTTNSFFDCGEFGFGLSTVSLEPLTDFPSNAKFIDGYYAAGDGTPVQISNAICIFERHAGNILWRHTEVTIPDEVLGY